MPNDNVELQKAWDKILALDSQLKVANGRLLSTQEELTLLKNHIKQHAADLMKLAR